MIHRMETSKSYVMWCYGEAVGCNVMEEKPNHFKCLHHGFRWGE